MFVFRVQDRWNEEGPYSCGWFLSDDLADDHNDGFHPGLRHILGDEYYGDGFIIPWFSAMDSLNSLREWFDGWVDRLIEYGHRFEICMVEIDPTGYGELDGQIAYHEGCVLSKVSFPITYLREGVLP